MKYLSLAALSFLVGCGVEDPSDKVPQNGDTQSNNDVTQHTTGSTSANNTTTADMGTSGGDDPDMALPPGDYPDAITSQGASFSGQLAPGQSILIDLTVFQSDRVTMWLRQENGTSWDPSLNVLRDGQADPLVYGNPRGNVDASIPFRSSELDAGYEFWFTGTYGLQLENLGDTIGDFSFTLECRGGPCAIAAGDADLDGTADAQDTCPYNPGDCTTSPYGASRNGELEAAIRADHADHKMLNYVEARVHMFAWIDKVSGQVEGVYTGDKVTTDEIPDPAQMNTEHGWPQSRSGGDPASESDLHHLFPTKPDANTERSSLYYGEVVNPVWERGGSSKGRNGAGDTVFEPRDAHKGDAARALFYYAVIYDVNMRPEEESVLRQWNMSDPPDEKEQRRNQSIENVQGSRNPFIDYPSLVTQIDDY